MDLTLLRLHVWMAIWGAAKKLADVAYDRAGVLYCRALATARRAEARND